MTISPHSYRPDQPAAHAIFHLVIRDPEGRIKHESYEHNLRTTAGIDWQAALMGNAAGTPAQYLALSNSSTVNGTTHPVVGDATLTGEIASGTDAGLARALGTYAHTGGTASYQIAKTFTAGTTQTIYGEALFTASTAGTMPFEANFTTPPAMNSGDSLALTVTVNY